MFFAFRVYDFRVYMFFAFRVYDFRVYSNINPGA